MDKFELPPVVQAIGEKGRIDADDVATLRRTVYADGVVSTAEAQGVFWLNDACDTQVPEWGAFFVESLSDFYVNQRTPRGYVDEDNADEIAHRILQDGRIRSASELELLANIVEKARSVPEKLILFALGEVRLSVLEGDGPIRRGLRLEPGVIAEAEVDLLRRLLYGAASDGNVKVTRLEAELLFDLNDAITGAESHQAWADLFVHAIANYVMAAQLWSPAPREEVMRRESWLEQRDGTLGFMRRMAEGGIGGALEALKADAEKDAAARRDKREKAIADAETVTADEAEWLAARIGRDGAIDDNERALLRRLRDEAPRIHPALRALIERAA